MEGTNLVSNPCGRETYTTAVLGGGRTGHRSSTSCYCQESVIGNPAQTLVNDSGSCSQVGDLAREFTKAPGKEALIKGWQTKTIDLEELQLSDPDSPIKTRRSKQMRRIITSSEEDDCLIVEQDGPGGSQTLLTLKAGRLPEKLRSNLRGIEMERARCSNIKGEVSGKIKSYIKDALIIADEIKERIDRQSGSPFSRAEAVIQLRTETKISDEKIRQMEDEIAKLKKEPKKREADKQSHGVKAVAAPNQGKPMPTTNRATPTLEKRLEDARVGDGMGCVMAVLRDYGKSIEALQRTQLDMWNIFKGTSAYRECVDHPLQDGFIDVVGRKKRRQKTKPAVRQEKTTTSGERGATGSATKKKGKRKKRKNRSRETMETAAISLVCNEAMSYRDALAKARESISLQDIGIDNITMMRGLTGAFIFSVRGKEAAVKADRVAEALRRTVPEAKIARLQKTRSFRLVGIDPSLNMTFWVPPSDVKWFSSLERAPLSAVLIGESGRPCSLVHRGNFFVAVKWGDSLVLSVYFPPSEVISEYCRLLDELEELLGRFPTSPVLVTSDFNARARRWDPEGRLKPLPGETSWGHWRQPRGADHIAWSWEVEAILSTLDRGIRTRSDGPGVRRPISPSPRVKYLGVVLDCSFTFSPHFAALIPKAEGILRSLGRLLPNLYGPGEKKRRLYSSVI
ncbi:hypothetical protein M0804_014321 [Polistes exclamans]|nr:hypothetical protein M0804_014321 [Polistes exclamans]